MFRKIYSMALRVMFPVSTRKKDREVARILSENDGRITSDRLLKIELGDALEKLNIPEDSIPKYDIRVRSLLFDPSTGLVGKTFFSLVTAGYVNDKKMDDYEKKGLSKEQATEAYNTIFMNRLLYSPVGQGGFLYVLSTMGRAVAAHIAAAGGGVMGVVSGVASFLSSRLLLSMFLISNARRNIFQELLTLPFRSITDTVGHEHIHILQKNDRDSKGGGTFHAFDDQFKRQAQPKEGFVKFLQTLDSVFSFSITNYLRHDYEVQARLHTALSKGVQEWGRLPENRYELWVALHDRGLSLPASVMADVKRKKELSKAFNETVRTFESGTLSRLLRKVTVLETAELQTASNAHITEELKEKFWRVSVPMLYGHLLCLYGKEDGIAMMLDFDRLGTSFANDNFPQNDVQAPDIKRAGPASPGM